MDDLQKDIKNEVCTRNVMCFSGDIFILVVVLLEINHPILSNMVM